IACASTSSGVSPPASAESIGAIPPPTLVTLMISSSQRLASADAQARPTGVRRPGPAFAHIPAKPEGTAMKFELMHALCALDDRKPRFFMVEALEARAPDAKADARRAL